MSIRKALNRAPLKARIKVYVKFCERYQSFHLTSGVEQPVKDEDRSNGLLPPSLPSPTLSHPRWLEREELRRKNRSHPLLKPLTSLPSSLLAVFLTPIEEKTTTM